MAHSPDVAEVTASIRLQRANLFLVAGCNELEPVPPIPPAVRQGVGHCYVQNPTPLPVSSPPVGRVQAVRHFGGPPVRQVFWDGFANLTEEPGEGDADRAAWLDEPGDI